MQKQTVGFGYGVLCDTLEEQANQQGFTLGKKAEELENCRQAAIMLRFGVDLPDSIYDKVLQRIQKRVVKAIKPVPQKNKTVGCGCDYISDAARMADTGNCRFCGCMVIGVTKVSENRYVYLCRDCITAFVRELAATDSHQQSKHEIACAHIKKWFDAKGIAVTDMECEELAAQLHALL